MKIWKWIIIIITKLVDDIFFVIADVCRDSNANANGGHKRSVFCEVLQTT